MWEAQQVREALATDGAFRRARRLAKLLKPLGIAAVAMVALKCPDIEVVVVDINEVRIKAWNSEELPIYEPGLDDVVKAARGRNLFFSNDVKRHVGEADIVFVR